MALNVKQEAFCLHYAKTGNATESYKKAGYKVKHDNIAASSAVQLLRNPKVKARLQELAEEIASEKIATVREVQEVLTSILRMQTTEEVVVTESTGDFMTEAKIIEKKPNLKDVIKAGETLAKMQGGFDNKAQIEVIIPVFGGEDELDD